jgi:hypothetical protein
MVRKGKDRDFHLKQIKHYLQTGKHHPDTTRTEKNGIVKATKRFVLSDNGKYIFLLGRNTYSDYLDFTPGPFMFSVFMLY